MQITKDHVKLAKRMELRWEDCEYGAPAIDCKRPYGNSDVEEDILRIIGDRPRFSRDGELSPTQSEKAAKLHKEMLGVIAVLLANAELVEGKDI